MAEDASPRDEDVAEEQNDTVEFHPPYADHGGSIGPGSPRQSIFDKTGSVNLRGRNVVVHSSDGESEEEKRDGIDESEAKPMGDVDATMDALDAQSQLQGRPSFDGAAN